MAKIIENPDEIVVCHKCKGDVKKKNLKRHLRKHKKLDEAKKASRPRLCDMNPAERKRCLNALDRPDREYSQDAYRRGKIISAGAYGLGKNRKH
tara:strand:+ start:621 stop:902 length:282 start_codon:yes stop_codon:yes gene_type:complete